MNKSETRQSIIDNRLLQSDWDVTNHTQVVEEFATNKYPTKVKDYPYE